MAKKERLQLYGVGDIYLTPKSVAVRTVTLKRDKLGRMILLDKTKYYPRTAKNMQIARERFGRIRVGRK